MPIARRRSAPYRTRISGWGGVPKAARGAQIRRHLIPLIVSEALDLEACLLGKHDVIAAATTTNRRVEPIAVVVRGVRGAHLRWVLRREMTDLVG